MTGWSVRVFTSFVLIIVIAGCPASCIILGKPNTLLALIKMAFHIPLKAGYTLDDMAADAIALLDALAIERAHIVGASMGGMIAQIIAARYPEHSISLTSIMSTSGRRGLPGPTKAARKVLFSRPPAANDPQGVINHFVNTMKVIGSPAYPVAHEVLQERITESAQRKYDIDLRILCRCIQLRNPLIIGRTKALEFSVCIAEVFNDAALCLQVLDTARNSLGIDGITAGGDQPYDYRRAITDDICLDICVDILTQHVYSLVQFSVHILFSRAIQSAGSMAMLGDQLRKMIVQAIWQIMSHAINFLQHCIRYQFSRFPPAGDWQ